MRKAKIIGTGMAVPDCVVDNHLLARCFTTSDEWITQRTGIKERRVLPSTYRFLLKLAEAPDKSRVHSRGLRAGSRRRISTPRPDAGRSRPRGVGDGAQERGAPDRRHRLHRRHHDDPGVRVPAHRRRHVGEVRPLVDAGAEPPAGLLRLRLRAGGGRRVHPDRHLPARCWWSAPRRCRRCSSSRTAAATWPSSSRTAPGRSVLQSVDASSRSGFISHHLHQDGRSWTSSSGRSTALRPTRSCRRRRSTTGGRARR